jgi:alpha-tubulin suppressor-like RCC1 family protein
MHNLALLGNGTIVAWGSNEDGQITIPKTARGIIGISAGLFHSLALKKNGTVLAWGYNEFGQCWIPTGLDDVVAIAAGALHSLALDDDGEVIAWGDNAFGQIFVPEEAEDDIIAIAAGYFHNLALTEDGEVIAWGDNASGQCNVPAAAREGVVAIAAGQNISLAVKADGTLISWGGGPALRGSNNKRMPVVSKIASGGSHNLAIVPDDADSNLDGIPDWWEVAYGLNRNSYDARTTDTDGDGQFDAEEFIADTDPIDAESVFGLALSFQDQATGNILYGPVSTDRIYSLEYTTDLASDRWEVVETFHNMPGLQAAPVAAIPMNMIPEAGNRIYRVRVALP